MKCPLIHSITGDFTSYSNVQENKESNKAWKSGVSPSRRNRLEKQPVKH